MRAVRGFVAGAEETLSMEVPAAPATPSPAAHSAARLRIPGQQLPRCAPLLIRVDAKRAQVMSSSRTRPPQLRCLFRFRNGW